MSPVHYYMKLFGLRQDNRYISKYNNVLTFYIFNPYFP